MDGVAQACAQKEYVSDAIANFAGDGLLEFGFCNPAAPLLVLERIAQMLNALFVVSVPLSASLRSASCIPCLLYHLVQLRQHPEHALECIAISLQP